MCVLIMAVEKRLSTRRRHKRLHEKKRMEGRER